MDLTGGFLGYLSKFIEISEEEFQKEILPFIEIRHCEKREILTRAGEVENYFNFIINGLIRKFYSKGKEEINTQISYEGHIIHCQESFHSRRPSEYTVEAIESSRVISITFENLEKIFAGSRKMEHLGRLIITHTMVLKDRWQMQIIKHTPRERFIQFVEKYPQLLQRVPQKYLASYLRIKPETFSRFKHLLRPGRVRGEEI